MSRADQDKVFREAMGIEGYAYTKGTTSPISAEGIAASACFQILNFENREAGKYDAAFQIGRLVTMLSSLQHLSMVERGKSNRDATRRGGEEASKSKNSLVRRKRIIEAMLAHKEKGHSISRAAELAAQQGFGTSKAANSQLWYRHRSER